MALWWLLIATPGHALPPLQLFIDLTPAGGTLNLPAGVYGGPAVIRKPLTIDGDGQVTVDGEGSGTVLSVLADGVVVRGLRLIRSGDSHDQVDAAILVSADNVRIEENTIADTLFGIHLRQANHTVIRGNRISSKKVSKSLRGEGIRLWYSTHNRIENNAISGVRDLVFSNSANNRVIGNTIRDSRIAMEFVFSPDNLVSENLIDNTTNGIVILYSHRMKVQKNRLQHLRELTGSALTVKGSSRAVMIDNEIVHCAVGLIANAPIHPEHVFQLRRNRFVYNDVALYFYGEKGGHLIHDNLFENNLTDVLVSASSSALDNQWRSNYWDRYRGFDRNNDGFGDTEYANYLYSDRLWMDRPATRFFRGSPSIEMVDFVERLAPFSPPYLVLTDPKPRIRR
ncbi:MAG: nitrous oxide reductase family maturation protein NosD [Gammaproteobacteria bacterium]